jgi:carboxypeptidase T
MWGCCGYSSSDPTREDYRGPGWAYATEVQVLMRFMNKHIVNGKQQFTAAMDFHTYGERILWPFGYTGERVVPGAMSQVENNTFMQLGTRMAYNTGYVPMQGYDFQPAEGTLSDWLWGAHRIYSFTMEMYPPPSNAMSDFYPPDDVIDRETKRAFPAVWRLMQYADCPPRIIGATCR